MWLPWILRRPSRCASRCSDAPRSHTRCYLSDPSLRDPTPQTLFLSLWPLLIPGKLVPAPVLSLGALSSPLGPYFRTLECCPLPPLPLSAFDPLLVPWIPTSFPRISLQCLEPCSRPSALLLP